MLSTVLKNTNNTCVFLLSFLLFILFPWRENLFTPQVKAKSREKYFSYITQKKCQLRREIKTFASIFLLTSRVISIL